MQKKDRKRGALLGLAIGDALGAAVEFQGRGTFEPVKGYRGGGPHPAVEAGDWTDDTSMALALGESLGEKGWDPLDQMRRYSGWMNYGHYTIPGYCFDIGNTTQKSIFKFEQTGQPFCGTTSDYDSGNGSIMRLAPVPIFYSDLYPQKIPELLVYAEESSRTTHGSNDCVSACQYMSLVIAALIEGEDKRIVLNSAWPPANWLLKIPNFSPEVAKIIKGSFRSGKPIRGTGYVVDSLEAALWAFDGTYDFEEAVLTAVNLGDDADTTGAVCGQIAGACYGESGIPKHLLEGLGGREMIENVLTKIVRE